jgi:catechol 2,3-dioxygenase-like lactoylglutathione lyase family enzyme
MGSVAVAIGRRYVVTLTVVYVSGNVLVIDDHLCEEAIMSRVQLALNVADVDAAVDFYSKLFGVQPAKRRPGYANFAIDEPPLKLVLIEDQERGVGVTGALNHLGVEVESASEVVAAKARLDGAQLDTLLQENTACCYAVQDKVWANDPDGAPWEWYTVLADAPEAGVSAENIGVSACCAPSTQSSDSGRPISACC